MLSKQAADIMRRLEIGEMPDHIERELGLSPAQQHKVVRVEVSRLMLEAARRMRELKPWPFSRGLLDFERYDKPLVVLEAWMKVRRLKRRYDRMNKATKAVNKESYARQIDAMLFYMRNAIRCADAD